MGVQIAIPKLRIPEVWIPKLRMSADTRGHPQVADVQIADPQIR